MLFDGLSQREIFILKNYFGLDGYEELTLEKIGEELNLTKERVRQIKECALKKDVTIPLTAPWCLNGL